GPEDLLARDPHVVRDRVEDRRLHEVAARLGARALAAEAEVGALLLAGLDVAEHAVELRLVDDRTHLRLRIERIARLDPLGDARDPLEELVLDVGVDEQPRAGVADLALVVEDAPGGSLRGGVEVAAVREDHVRRLAAALER